MERVIFPGQEVAHLSVDCWCQIICTAEEPNIAIACFDNTARIRGAFVGLNCNKMKIEGYQFQKKRQNFLLLASAKDKKGELKRSHVQIFFFIYLLFFGLISLLMTFNFLTLVWIQICSQKIPFPSQVFSFFFLQFNWFPGKYKKIEKKGCHFFNPRERDRNMKRIITPKSLKSSHLGVFFCLYRISPWV